MNGQGPAGRRLRLAAILLLTLALIAASGLLPAQLRPGREDGAATRPPIGLFTSLPILWRESDDISGLLDNSAPAHWALDVLADHGQVRPIDTLAGQGGRLSLDRRAILVLAQPRPLSPLENVALDDWVRGGGGVLLFADPMLTAPSDFAPGDSRRPQDIAMLSPILARWGLVLQFDDAQPAGAREARLFGAPVPVNLPGQFAAVPGDRGCVVEPGGLAALCRVGSGRVLAVADAALLESGGAQDRRQRRETLESLLARVRAGD